MHPIRLRLSLLILTGVTVLAPSAHAEEARGVATPRAVSQGVTAMAAGKGIFERRCAECHAAGFGHPGTQRLGTLRGASMAVLEARTDLKPEYVSTVVRHGLVEMPAFRPTEITDAELAQLAAYLASPKARQ